MLLVWIFLCSHIFSKPLSQHLYVFSILFGARLIIAACVKIDGTLNTLDQPYLIATVEVLDVEGRVDGSDGRDVVELGRHPESCPSTPAIACSNKFLNSLIFDIGRQLLVFRLDFFHLLLLDHLQDLWDVLDGALINRLQKLRQKDLIAEFSIGVGDKFMPSTLYSEDVFEKDEGFPACSNFIDFASPCVDYLSLGSVVDLEGGPGPGRTADVAIL